MKQGWCRQAYKDLLWRAASVTNVRNFKKCMLELKTMNAKAHEWLNKIPVEHWARSHFLVIMEYLVKVSKRRAFCSLNKDILKITILTTNTPYPSRKIRRIRACTHKRPQRKEDQYAVSRRSQYAVLKILYMNILEDVKRGPYSKKLQYAVSNPLNTPLVVCEYLIVLLMHCSGRKLDTAYPLPSDTAPKIEDNDNFELKGQFLKELRTNTFSGSDNEDANEHIEKVLEIVDLFHIPNITIDQVMLRAFPISLIRAASR
ncbi:hypothetical protein Tco_0343689 [Tanacetum coccineum]